MRKRKTPVWLAVAHVTSTKSIPISNDGYALVSLAIRRKPRRLAAMIDSHGAEGAMIYLSHPEPRGLTPV